MALSVGDTLPDATFIQIGAEGPEQVKLSDKIAGRKVVIFGLPGAFTSTCTSAHLPSFIRTKDQLAAKGVDEIICVSVNDPFVMDAWGKSVGADGITLLADPAADFTKAVGMNFSAPPVGFYDRSSRYALVAENGVVKVLNADDQPGVCDLSAGETILETL